MVFVGRETETSIGVESYKRAFLRRQYNSQKIFIAEKTGYSRLAWPLLALLHKESPGREVLYSDSLALCKQLTQPHHTAAAGAATSSSSPLLNNNEGPRKTEVHQVTQTHIIAT